jgi:hypothetical protein
MRLKLNWYCRTQVFALSLLYLFGRKNKTNNDLPLLVLIKRISRGFASGFHILSPEFQWRYQPVIAG